MADNRLKELHTSQMTESAVNRELLEWLQKHGWNILLAVLLLILAGRGWLWMKERRVMALNEAWADLAGAGGVAPLLDVAQRHEGVGSISELARLRAADIHLRTLSTNVSETTPGEDADAPIEPMTEQEREDLLGALERLYQEVADSTETDAGKRSLRLQALFGLAAVAEMRGDTARAEELYVQVQSEATGAHEAFSTLAQGRMDDLSGLGGFVVLPTDAQVREARTPPAPVEPESDAGTEEGASEPAAEDGAEEGGESPAAEEPAADEPAADEPAEEPAGDDGA